MSWEVVGLVSKRQCGGAVRRVLLLTLANYAGNDGRDIYASIPSLARDSEVDPRTVQRNIKALMDDGLLELVGRRKCRNGYTNEYRLRLSALKALPEIIRTEDLAAEEPDPRQAATPAAKPVAVEAEFTPVTAPPVTERPPGTVSPDPRQVATQPCQITISSSADQRAEARERILAACGPGLADPAKSVRPLLDLKARLPVWLEKWDLELDILPVVEARTLHPRSSPMGDFRFIEDDIAKFHARRLQALPVAENSNERIGQGAGAPGGNAQPRGHARPGGQQPRAGLAAAAARNREFRENQTDVPGGRSKGVA